MVLLVGAGLAIRSFLKIYQAPLGFDPSRILTMRLPLPETRYPGSDAKIAFHDRLHMRLASLARSRCSGHRRHPSHRGIATLIPMNSEGAPSDEQHRAESPPALVISPDYFPRNGRACLSHGRAFTESDGVSGPPVVRS